MKQYHKINTLYKRDTKGKILLGDWAMPELEYLQNNQWEFTEKIDGTNIRVMWNDGLLTFGGKTDNAEIPKLLLGRLADLFADKAGIFAEIVPQDSSLCLYGEGFGNRIQSVGKQYIPNDVDFVLFDVKVDGWWLERRNIEDIAQKLGIEAVPLLGFGSLQEAIDMVKQGFPSAYGTAQAEGIVARPVVPLFSKKGERIITKIKHKDFKGDL